MSQENANDSPFSRWVLPLLAFLAPLALYFTTACRDIFWMDSTELMLCGRFLLVPHPPGYPLLVLLLKLRALVPLFSMPFRMNLVSSVAAAGSCLFVFLTVRGFTRRDAAALYSALLWAVSFELWQQATALEVYALHVLFASCLFYLVSTWARTARTGYLLAGCAVFGLSLAHHPTVVLLVPSLLILAFDGPIRILSRRSLFIGALLLVSGLPLYLLVLVKAGPTECGGWGGVRNLADLLRFVTAQTYQYRVLAGGTEYFGAQLRALPLAFGKQFLLGWLPLAPGAVWCLRHNRSLLLSSLIAAALVTLAAVAYNIPDKEGYLLPAYLSLLLVTGTGLASIRARLFLHLAGLAAILLPAVVFFRVEDRHSLKGLRDYAASVIAELPEDAVLFTDDYSAVQGLRWLAADSGNPKQLLVVSEHHLAFPWYLEHLSAEARVPDQIKGLARELWQHDTRAASFGDRAQNTVSKIKFGLVSDWRQNRRLFWLPRGFQTWPESWFDIPLRLNGLTFELSPDTLSQELPIEFFFPGPARYRVGRGHDRETQDLCRRFAAAANRRGILKFKHGDNPGAFADFRLALEYFPGYPSAIENKGLVYFYASEPESARKYLNLFLETSPDVSEALKVRQFLDRLDQTQEAP